MSTATHARAEWTAEWQPMDPSDTSDDRTRRQSFGRVLVVENMFPDESGEMVSELAIVPPSDINEYNGTDGAESARQDARDLLAAADFYEQVVAS